MQNASKPRATRSNHEQPQATTCQPAFNSESNASARLVCLPSSSRHDSSMKVIGCTMRVRLECKTPASREQATTITSSLKLQLISQPWARMCKLIDLRSHASEPKRAHTSELAQPRPRKQQFLKCGSCTRALHQWLV